MRFTLQHRIRLPGTRETGRREAGGKDLGSKGRPHRDVRLSLFNFLKSVYPWLMSLADSALQVLAHRFERGRQALVAEGYEQLAEYPFSSELKRMAVIFRRPSLPVAEKSAYVALMKGATERVLDACMYIQAVDGVRPIKAADQDEIMHYVDVLAHAGLRVLSLAGREWAGATEQIERGEVEKDMTFFGLVGIYDPPRTFPQSFAVLCAPIDIEYRA